jgi:hypothetical protein
VIDRCFRVFYNVWSDQEPLYDLALSNIGHPRSAIQDAFWGV